MGDEASKAELQVRLAGETFYRVAWYERGLLRAAGRPDVRLTEADAQLRRNEPESYVGSRRVAGGLHEAAA